MTVGHPSSLVLQVGKPRLRELKPSVWGHTVLGFKPRAPSAKSSVPQVTILTLLLVPSSLYIRDQWHQTCQSPRVVTHRAGPGAQPLDEHTLRGHITMISMELQRDVPQYMAIPWLMT